MSERASKSTISQSALQEEFVSFYDSPVGFLKIKSDGKSILEVLFYDQKEGSEMSCDLIDECKRQLDEYFARRRISFDLSLLPSGTLFQKEVWNQLVKIPYGKTISYLHLARELGDEKKIRAAGSANGKNPIAIIIPCHRVIGSDGSLVGYGGGLWRKKWLLEWEQGLHQTALSV